VSRSPWAWTKSSYGHLAHAVSSLTAIERAATVVMLMLAVFPAAALGKVGNPHPRRSAASTTRASHTTGAAHSKSHNSSPPGAVRPARHAGNSSRELLALGSGYSAPQGSKAVKFLQGRLVAAGFSPGPIDGRYGVLTERAVIGFQATHGLQVDGIAGSHTRAVLAVAQPVLRPGTGYARGGSRPIRKLQRDLTAAGYSPGPFDGRYGPATERAVMRLQHARHLLADGIAGPQTLHQLRAILSQRSHSRTHRVGLRPGSARHRSRPRSGRSSGARTPPRSATPQPSGGTHSAGSPSTLWIVLVACLLMAMLARALWRRHRGRGGNSFVATPRPDAGPGVADDGRDQPAAAFELGVMLVLARYRAAARDAFRQPDQRRRPNSAFDLRALLPQYESRVAAEHAFQVADDRGHPGAACNLGVLLEQRGDLPGAQEAYRRADERGHAVGAYNLGALLEQQGDVSGAIAAYRRADERGDSMGAYSLGVLLERDGDLSGAKAAYRRADQRGDPDAACNLGLLLKQEGDRIGALRALERAGRHGSPESTRVARTALLELNPNEHTQRNPADQGKAAAVSEPDPAARLPARWGDQTW
jgi:peptidoglycan hydrolase-like protein with peptidoglycan-binding domain/TPR repeat protein